MIKKFYQVIVCSILTSIVFLSSSCMTQMAVNKNDESKTYANNINQNTEEKKTTGNINEQIKEESSNLFSNSEQIQKVNRTTEADQEMMEKILDLLEEADNYWDNGDIDNAVVTLDKAYALLLEVDGNAEMPRQKDDLRLLISKRILAVYSAQQSITRGTAGEIPLKMNKAIEREIQAFQGHEREFFISSYQRSSIYKEVIMKELKMAGLPEELFWLPLVESGYKINALSRSRALGLWQFIPSTGYKFGLSRDEWIDERMDPIKSTKAAIAYLKELHSMFGDWLTALAAYNCGEGRILRTISRQKINYFDRFWDLYDLLPRETARYVPRFLATLHIIKDPQMYGFDLPEQLRTSLNFNIVKINKMMRLKDIAESLEISEELLSLLNAELRHKITPDREYFLKIPSESLQKFELAVNEIPEAKKPSLAAKTLIVRHRVRRGETLSLIARRYRVSMSSIRAVNNLKRNGILIAGKVLSIPLNGRKGYITTRSKDSMHLTNDGSYKVKRGDVLQIIAKRFDVSVASIKDLNNLKSDVIYAGQILKIREDSDKQMRKTKLTTKVLTGDDIDSLGTDKYIVTKGDNLYRIALKNNINVARLKELNNLSDEKIIPGQILIVK